MEFDGNNNLPSKVQNSLIQAEQSRTIAAVQAQFISARRFPRDETEAFKRVMKACERKSLAEKAIYQYPRGGEIVSGPSIRLAECIAQARGNMEFGIVELAQEEGFSIMQAYCTDFETNTTRRQEFIVPHVRSTKKGQVTLEDPRDIYENNANMGSRRLRASILAITPGDLIEEAIKKCRETKASMVKSAPLEDRVRNLVMAFDKIQVDTPMIEAFLKHSIKLTTADEFIKLHEIYQTIVDGEAKRIDFFTVAHNPNQSVQPEDDTLKKVRAKFSELYKEFFTLGGKDEDLGMSEKDVMETNDVKGIINVNEAMQDWISEKRKEAAAAKKAAKQTPPAAKPNEPKMLAPDHPIRKKIELYCSKEFKPEQFKKYFREMLTKDVGSLSEKQFDQLASSAECGNLEEVKTYIAGLKDLK